jgi:hypothetical protein
VGIDRGSTDQILGELKTMPETAADRFENLYAFGDDLGTDAVTGQNCDLEGLSDTRAPSPA